MALFAPSQIGIGLVAVHNASCGRRARRASVGEPTATAGPKEAAGKVRRAWWSESLAGRPPGPRGPRLVSRHAAASSIHQSRRGHLLSDVSGNLPARLLHDLASLPFDHRCAWRKVVCQSFQASCRRSSLDLAKSGSKSGDAYCDMRAMHATMGGTGGSILRNGTQVR
jgi:hypothetical protein